ncbi:MAG: glycine cleavage system protein GcvH [Actinomycetota bacterium]|nr:glycine cleavage system protein GcvH [Actinomycetota bacterium]
MNVPDDRRYTKDHEWARIDGRQVWVGITDHAQSALGDIVYVELPQVGAEVAANDAFSEVESTKSVSDVYAPLPGTVVEVNRKLADAPQELNEDPYGAGWICVLEVADDSGYQTLLSAEAYRELIAEEQ